MKDTWHNNRISKKLNEEYPRSFSLQDIDGMIHTYYKINDELITRLIIYESKNEHEKMGHAQKRGLQILNKAIDWKRFDEVSGIYIIKIVDLDNELIWEDVYGNIKFTTTFDGLFNIFCPNYQTTSTSAYTHPPVNISTDL